MNKKKILIAYYSRRGNNYVNGTIANLSVGNTEVAAKKIQALIGGELFEIQTVEPYPADYTKTTQAAQEELAQNTRPALAGTVADISAYDTLFIGYPNWWSTMPMAVFAFLETYDLAEKIIFPFCTHEGSGLGRSEQDIKRLCPNSTIMPGLAIQGGRVHDAEKNITAWLKNQGVLT